MRPGLQSMPLYRVTDFDSKLRDSNFAAGKFTMGMRIDDLTDMRVGVGAQSRNSDGLCI